jgi:phage-related protein
MASVPTITFDGTDIITFGAFLNAGPTGWLDAPGYDAAQAMFAGGIGGVISRYPTIRMRTLTLPLRVVANSLADRVTYEGSLKSYQGRNVVVRIADGSTTREITGRCLDVRLTPYRIPNALVSDGSATFLCPDPYWQATTASVLSVSGTETTIPLGTGPVSDWVLEVDTGITDLTVTIKDGTGATLHTLTWTGTLGSPRTLLWDAGTFTVAQDDGTDELADTTGGFPVLDPADEPTITLTATSGTPTGELRYRVRYA